MSWRGAVLTVAICALLFLTGFAWILYTMVFGGEDYKRLAVKFVMLIGAIILSAEAVKHANEDEFCVAALLSSYAFLMTLGAIFAI
jgi:apolipoprotein N-acyltransferase